MNRHFFSIILLLTVIITNFSCLTKIETLQDRKNIKDIKREINNYNSTNWETRLKAVKKITSRATDYNSSIAEKFLIKATYDIHPVIKIESLKGLAILQLNTSISRIIEMSSSEKNSNVKWYTLKSLALYRDSALAMIFVKNFRSDDWLIKEISIIGILMIKNRSEQQKLTSYIVKAVNCKNETVTISTLKYLNIRNNRIYKAITDLLKKTKMSRLTLLSEILISLNGYKIDSKTKERVISLLSHKNYRIRILALKILKSDKKIAESEE